MSTTMSVTTAYTIAHLWARDDPFSLQVMSCPEMGY
eukprot:gene2547-13389_t